MIDPIFNMFKVKFDVMDSLNIIRPDDDRVIFYINMENVFKVLFNLKVNNYMKGLNDPKYTRILLTSNILNLAAHYKLYCAKENIQCKVVLYSNTHDMSDLDNKEYIKSYKNYLCSRLGGTIDTHMVYKVVNECYDFINIIIKYLDDVYFIQSPHIESSVIPYILYREKFNDNTIQTHHVIIANTKYEYQYTNFEFTILEPKSDDSKRVDKFNVIDILKEKNNIKNNKEITTTFIPLILTILGDKYRSIDKIPGAGLSHIINMVNQAIAEFIITEDTSNVDMLSKIISEEYRDEFIKKYRCIDITTQYKHSSLSDIAYILEQIEDKFDEYTLEAINDKCFKRSPLLIVNTKKQKYNTIEPKEEGKSLFS